MLRNKLTGVLILLMASMSAWTQERQGPDVLLARLTIRDAGGANADSPGVRASASSGGSSASSTSLENNSAFASQPTPSENQPVLVDNNRVRPFSKLAIGIDAGTLGIGAELATPLTRKINLRGNAEFFNFGYGTTIDGADYQGQLHLKDGQFSVDWFPFGGGFRISPGFVIWKSSIAASVQVSAGDTFELGKDTYFSSATDPVSGNANILFGQTIMPSLTLGFGNIITRPGKHWSIPFEFGAAYTGHYTLQLNLKGTACQLAVCMSTSSATVQRSLAQEESDLNESAKRYQILPIVRAGLAYRF